MVRHQINNNILIIIINYFMWVFHRYSYDVLFCDLLHCRILYLYNITGKWAYPFMKHFTPIMFGLFILGSVMICGVFYSIGLLVARACGNISEFGEL